MMARGSISLCRRRGKLGRICRTAACASECGMSRKRLEMMGPRLLADSVPTYEALLGKPRCC